MCKHHFIYESPNGEFSKGICKLCGTTDVARNALPMPKQEDFLNMTGGIYMHRTMTLPSRRRGLLNDDNNPGFDDMIAILER
jgi:hypothetical protein